MICTVEVCVCSLLDLEGKRCDWILSNITLLLSSVPRRSKTKTIYQFKKKRLMFQEEICYETRKTFETVKKCPEHHSVIIQRSQMKNCSKYPMCHDKQLIYHCFGYNESFVEVCAPISRIVGKQCHLSNNLFKTLQNCFPKVLYYWNQVSCIRNIYSLCSTFSFKQD